MGGAGRAGGEATEIIFLNPTAAALGIGFEAGLLFKDGYWTKGEHESSFAVTFVENDPSNISPGAFAYVQTRKTVPGLAWNEKCFFGALAKSITPQFTLGLSIYNLQQELETGATYAHWNGSVGVLVAITEALGIAYVYQNPANPDEDTPVPMQPITQQSLGVNWLIPNLMRIVFDITRWDDYNPDQKGILQLGSEMRLAMFGVFRLGYQIDDIDKRNSITGGIGFIGPRLRANYSISKPLKDTDGAMHSVDLRLPF
jgi:hypothetical protein